MKSKYDIKRDIFRSDRMLKAFEKKYKKLLYEALQSKPNTHLSITLKSLTH